MEEVESKLCFAGWLCFRADKRPESYIPDGQNNYPQGPDIGR